jgi:hypothetical protein
MNNFETLMLKTNQEYRIKSQWLDLKHKTDLAKVEWKYDYYMLFVTFYWPLILLIGMNIHSLGLIVVALLTELFMFGWFGNTMNNYAIWFNHRKVSDKYKNENLELLWNESYHGE